MRRRIRSCPKQLSISSDEEKRAGKNDQIKKMWTRRLSNHEKSNSDHSDSDDDEWYIPLAKSRQFFNFTETKFN